MDHTKHMTWRGDCQPCREEARAADFSFDHQNRPVQNSELRKLAATGKGIKLRTPETIRLASLERKARLSADIMRQLDHHSAAVWTNEVKGTGARSSAIPMTVDWRDARAGEQRVGAPAALDPRVAQAIAARRELAQLKRDERAEELVEGRIDARKSSKREALARATELGLSPDLASRVIQENDKDREERRKAGLRDKQVAARIAKMPLNAQGETWQRVHTNRLDEKVAAAKAAGAEDGRVDVRTLSPREFLIYKQRRQHRWTTQARGIPTNPPPAPAPEPVRPAPPQFRDPHSHWPRPENEP